MSAETDTPCHRMPHQRLVKTMQMIEHTGSAYTKNIHAG